MPVVQSCLMWCRRNLAWSNSRQSWEERLGGLALVAGVVCAFWHGSRLSALQQVLVWGLLFVAAAVLLRRGWLKLFGPVLFYDMIRSARRGRYILLRCLYAGLLLFLLWTTWMNTRHYGWSSPQQAAVMAESYFSMFMGVQLAIVVILTPAYVAGAIADEKDRKTLEFLLATDLRNREIVLSKLCARLANLSLLLLTGLPVLSLLQFLGGVDPNLVLAGFAATALTMLGIGGLSIFNSTHFKRPRDAIAVTYLGITAYYALSLLAWVAQASGMRLTTWPLWFGATPLTINDLITAFNSGNLFWVMGEIIMAVDRGTLAQRLPALLGSYALFQGLVGVVCTGWSVLRLRAVALKQVENTSGRRGRRPLIQRPRIGSLPMLWKELFVEGGVRLHWTGWIVVVLLVGATLTPAGVILYYNYIDGRYGGGGYHYLAESMNVWVRIVGTMVACLMLLAVAVRASTSIGGERDRQTLDALLTSPLSSDDILLAKCLGSILSVRLAWLWLGAIFGLGVLTGGLHILALPLVIGAWFLFAGFLATLGCWFSIVSRTTLRATVWTLLTTSALAGGHWLPWMCCGPLFAYSGSTHALEYLAKFQAGLTPPVVLPLLMFSGEEFHTSYRSREMAEMLGFSLFGLCVWTLVTIVFWIAVSARFRVVTNRVNMHTQDVGPAWSAPRERRPPRPPPPPAEEPESLNVILLEETWETPDDALREDEDRPDQPGHERRSRR